MERNTELLISDHRQEFDLADDGRYQFLTIFFFKINNWPAYGRIVK